MARSTAAEAMAGQGDGTRRRRKAPTSRSGATATRNEVSSPIFFATQKKFMQKEKILTGK